MNDCCMLKVVSGGQTGVDRAALDAALEVGLRTGGWCPRGRRAEDGVIPARYPLQEAPSVRYELRTRLNVEHSDGTLILARGPLSGGTLQTLLFARQMQKPHWVVQLDRRPDWEAALAWLLEHHIRVLNVAGPRESNAPGIAAQARAWLVPLFLLWKEHGRGKGATEAHRRG